MVMEFDGQIWLWKGPAPWYFVTLPAEQSDDLKEVLRLVAYGWGMIPVVARIGQAQWKTAVYPKDGRYILPIKAVVREAEELEERDTVTVRLELR